MKKRSVISCGWELSKNGGEWLEIPQMPMMVHDILYHHGRIGSEYQKGHTSGCAWVPECQWTYRVSFIRPEWEGPVRQ